MLMQAQVRPRSRMMAMLLALAMVVCIGLFVCANNAYATTDTIDVYVNSSPVADITRNGIDVGSHINYSSRNCQGTYKYYTAEGESLADLLEVRLPVGKTLSDITSVYVHASDNEDWTFSYADLFNTRYYYPSGGGTAVAVPALIATAYASGVNQSTLYSTDTLRLFVGQSSSTEQNNDWYLKNIDEIDVTTN